ncbi:hypothetical protein TNCT_447181 [Trichonephila clavata]|uniref:Uncharacterized protein n=1 Tax=Trichonephila clavata TaxID=2740835 RepID=A0A8X6LP72_TRICU|nr:hypothetical protein TNCT_447181 [Trichonephila clavata]
MKQCAFGPNNEFHQDNGCKKKLPHSYESLKHASVTEYHLVLSKNLLHSGIKDVISHVCNIHTSAKNNHSCFDFNSVVIHSLALEN